MNNIHPILQAALKPFAPPPVQAERYYRVEARWNDGEIEAGFGYTILSTSHEAAMVWGKGHAGARPNLEVTVHESDYVHVERPLSHFEPVGYEGQLREQQDREVHAWGVL